MSELTQEEVRNTLLRRLPASAFEKLAPHLQPLDLPLRYPLALPDEPIEHVVFIEAGLASMVVEDDSGRRIEVRHIGYEGMTGYTVVLGADQSPTRTFMQMPGRGLKVPARDVVSLLDDPQARLLLLRYIHTCDLQLSFTTLATSRYSLPQRLARWLLMCHDRIEGDTLTLTHDFLSLMLGVRRASVTDQLHVLEGTRAIRSTRGQIRILNRETLLRIAGGCYGTPEEEYERLIRRGDVPQVDPEALTPIPTEDERLETQQVGL